MKRFAVVIFILCSLLLSACGKTVHNKHQLKHKMMQLIESFKGDPSIGIIIKNLHSGKILFSLNPKRTFVPASTTKTLTATAALDFLGVNYHYQTRLAYSGRLQKQNLNGNLYVLFSGDPSFTTQDLDALLQAAKLKSINGNIVINTAPFATYKPGIGFMWDDLNFCFSAPANAVILNHNCFRFQMYPNKSLNAKAIIRGRHNMAYTPIQNAVTTQLLPPNLCDIDMDVDKHNHYHVYGCIPYKSSPYLFEVAVRNPHYYLRQFLLNWLQTSGINFKGKIIFANQKKPMTILATHDSKPLAHLIKHMLKKSDNLYANSLFKLLGADYMDAPANWTNGAMALKKILKPLGVNIKLMHIVDGAGLSRYNRIAPEVLMQILVYNYQHPDIGNAFFQGLSIAGTDGTLRHYRMLVKDTHFRGKTGDMTFVTSLAGYLKTRKNTPIAVVMMFNGIQKQRRYFAFSHKVLHLLIESKL